MNVYKTNKYPSSSRYTMTDKGDIEVTVTIPLEAITSGKVDKCIWSSVDCFLDALNTIQRDVALHPDVLDVRNDDTNDKP